LWTGSANDCRRVRHNGAALGSCERDRVLDHYDLEAERFKDIPADRPDKLFRVERKQLCRVVGRKAGKVIDDGTARDMLEKLPLGQAHLMSFELIPIGPLNPLRQLQGMKANP
jgi:hypothetical protein